MNMRLAFLGTYLCLILLEFGSSLAQAQNNGFGGISIDADGLVSAIAPLKESSAAAKKRQAAYKTTHLSEPLATPTESRRVSLLQLDEQLAELSKSGTEIPLELKYVGGLTRIDYVIVDRESRDLAIVGPAEGFAPDLQGRMRGTSSGRPVLNLEDLLVAWRAVQAKNTYVSCSIDPTKEGIAAFNNFTSQNQVAQPNTVGKLFDTMAIKLGRQAISVQGVPKDTHFAVILVEADLRMKRIALGRDPSQVKGVSSHLAFLRAGGNSMSRWWFIPLYDPIQVNADRSLYHLSGQRLQLLGQDEFTTAQGDRSNAPFTKKGTTKFVQQFTDHIPELAVAHPAIAELQNLFDWMVVCTLIRNHQLHDSIQWKPVVLGDISQLATRVYPIPEGVDSVAMTHRVGRTVFGLVGGVELNANDVVSKTSPLDADPARALPTRHESRAWND